MIHNETGRSMVEMLGVLAIMGVITLGGLAGYRTAMNKLRANAITELVAELSVEAQTHNKKFELTDLEDVGEVTCLDGMTGASNGQVKIVFSAGCDDIKDVFKTSFAKCKLDEKEGYVLYIPNRGNTCTSDECSSNCEDYTSAFE